MLRSTGRSNPSITGIKENGAGDGAVFVFRMDNLYTVIVDYAGGTYISQVRATDETEALMRWCVAFSAEEGVPETVRSIGDKALANLDLLELVALKGCTSAWCATITHSGHLALINIVKTATD